MTLTLVAVLIYAVIWQVIAIKVPKHRGMIHAIGFVILIVLLIYPAMRYGFN